MKNSVLEIDPKRYGRLLASKLPAVIRTENENERLIAELEDVDRRRDELSPEEREYSELLTVLIEAFEDANYALEDSTPHSRLRSLMEEHGLRQRDLWAWWETRNMKACATRFPTKFTSPAPSRGSRMGARSMCALRATQLNSSICCAPQCEEWMPACRCTACGH